MSAVDRAVYYERIARVGIRNYGTSYFLRHFYGTPREFNTGVPEHSETPERRFLSPLFSYFSAAEGNVS